MDSEDECDMHDVNDDSNDFHIEGHQHPWTSSYNDFDDSDDIVLRCYYVYFSILLSEIL